MQMSQRKVLVVLSLMCLFVYAIFFCGTLFLDRHVGDLDGDSRFAYPIYGQDSPNYALLGENLLSHHFFSKDNVHSETFRTPAYPLLLAATLGLTGSFFPVLLLQSIFALLLSCMLFLMGSTLGYPRAGFVAALLFLLSPSTLFHSLVILTDLPFTFFVVLAVYLLFFSKRRSLPIIFASGLCLGIATLFRPIALLLPFLFVFFKFFVDRPFFSKQKTISVLLVLFGFALVMAPWMIRNKVEEGVYALSSIGPYNFAFSNIPDFLSQKFGKDSLELSSYRKRIDTLPPTEAESLRNSSKLRSFTNPYLEEYLFEYTKFHLSFLPNFFFGSSIRYVVQGVAYPSVKKFFGLDENAQSIREAALTKNWKSLWLGLRQQFFFNLDRLFLVFFTVAAFLSLLLVRRQRPIVLLLLCTVLYFAFLTGPVAIVRYRLPADPLILLLGCIAVSILYGHMVSWWRKNG